MDKGSIRAAVLAKRDALSDDEIVQKSRLIFEKLIKTKEYKESVNILVYASMGSEVRTDEIILDALANGKKVFCPKVTDKKAGTMVFIRIGALEDLEEGYFHIREPKLDEDSEIMGRNYLGGYEQDCLKEAATEHEEDINCRENEKTLVIMPGVAFDRNRNRIGYGGGFYDRYLSGHPDYDTVALCFDEQLISDSIEPESTDAIPGCLLTDGM